MDAREVLREMVARYTSLTSYSDTGRVTCLRPETGDENRIAFSTLYKSPSYFRFAFTRPHAYRPLRHLATQHVAGFDGTSGYVTMKGYDGRMTDKFPITLSSAVAHATGISRGSAHTIGRLLLPEVGGRSLVSSLEPTRATDVVVDDTPFYIIKTRGARGDLEEELWIEKSSFLLRKLISRREDRESTEMRENIIVDGPLENSLFEHTS